jgi:hypothetical protein
VIRSVGGSRVPDERTLAVVIAAVQAYLDDEAGTSRIRGPIRLSRWKTAPWQVFRDRTALWRHGD